MRKIRWILLAVLCIAAAAVLGGCKNVQTMTIDTKLIIDQNFDGERVMTAVLDKNAFKSLFGSDVTKLQSMIEKYCPVQMSCRASASGESALVEMSVPFASYNEYQEKIRDVLEGAGDNINSAVYYEYSSNLFKSGYTIEEKFTSADLFYWLKTALKTEYSSLKDEDLSKLFKDGKTELVFGSDTIETEAYIKHSTMQSHGFKAMAVETVIQEDNSVNASVSLTISDENAKAISGLEDMMKKMAEPDFALMTKSGSGEKTYVFSFETSSLTTYIQHMNSLLHTDNTVFEITKAQDDTQTLKAKQYIRQYMDASYFVDYSLPDASVTYSIKLPGKLSFDTCEGKSQYITDTDYSSDDKSTTATVAMNPSDEITFGFGSDIALEEIDVYTKIYNEHKLERTLNFTLSKEKDELIGENFVGKLQERLKDNISYEKEEKKDESIYKVTIKAKSSKEMSALTSWFLNGTEDAEDISLSGGINEKNSLNKIRYAYDDKIDFSGFLGGSDSTNGIIYMFEYPKGYDADFTDASAYEDVAENGNTLVCKTFNKTVSIKTTAEKGNTEGLILQILWYLSFAGILIAILFSLPNLIRCAKARSFSGEELELYTKKGHVLVTVFAVSAVIFIIASIRLMFGVY